MGVQILRSSSFDGVWGNSRHPLQWALARLESAPEARSASRTCRAQFCSGALFSNMLSEPDVPAAGFSSKVDWRRPPLQ